MNKKNKMIKLEYNAPVILNITLFSFIALIGNILTYGKLNELLFMSYKTSLLDPLLYIRLFTHILGHESIEHFENNIIFFLLLGPLVEKKYGSKNLFFMILFTSFFIGVLNIIINTDYAILGLSGIVYMLMVMSAILCFEERKIPLTFIVVMAIFIYQLLTTPGIFTDEITQLGHFIGGVSGLYFGFNFMKYNKNSKGENSYG